MDKGNYVLGLFLDLKKAFDTVDHQILLDKLETIGIRGHALQFFNSYLTDRKQFVIINGKNSKTKYITTGVPQGSVLGPLFFLIYINDIQYACNSENSRLFADDTSYFLHDKKLENLMNKAKTTVTNLQQWLSANKLSLNIEKTMYVIFRNKNKQMGKIADDLQVGNNVFKREKSCQYIGMMLDEKMNWDEHINNVKSKLIKYVAIFNYMKTYVSKQLAMQLYYAFIFPHIKYGIETYGASSSGKVKQIQIIQNKLMKIILWKDRLTPTNALHKDINILQVKDMYSWYIALFVRDCLYKDKIEIFHKYYESRNSVHSHETRNRKQVIEPTYRTDIGFTTVKSKGSKIWNKLPEEIKKLNIRTTYKNKLRSKYIESYD